MVSQRPLKPLFLVRTQARQQNYEGNFVLRSVDRRALKFLCILYILSNVVTRAYTLALPPMSNADLKSTVPEKAEHTPDQRK